MLAIMSKVLRFILIPPVLEVVPVVVLRSSKNMIG
jgi:hypothetical protein